MFIDQFDSGFVGGAGLDSLRAIDATAAISIVATDFEDFLGTPFDDVIDASGTTVNINSMQGAGGADTLMGGSGNDTIFGGDGDDMLFGGLGRDVLRGDAGADTLDGGGDLDTTSYRNSPAGVIVNLSTGTAADDGFGTADTLIGIECIDASDFADVLTGDAGANVIFGRGGDDVIEGLGGPDTLYGNGGVDLLSYEHSPAGVRADLGANAFTGGDATGDSVTGFENLNGSAFSDVLAGSSAANIIFGGAGNDNINGRDGGDRLLGGDGNDTIRGGAGVDQIDAGADNDTVYADTDDDGSGLFTGGTGTDRLLVDGSGPVDWAIGTASFEIVSGSNLDDVIDLTGATAGVSISGRGGADMITGGDGGDTINGGAGADTIFGGLGMDVIRGDADDDTMYGNVPTAGVGSADVDDGVRDRFFGGDGTDIAYGNPPDAAAVDVETTSGF